jgi:hypothetical protein
LGIRLNEFDPLFAFRGPSCQLRCSPRDACCSACVQASHLKRLALYFDVGMELWTPGAPWGDLSPSEWDGLFLPGIGAAEPAALTAPAAAAGGSTAPPPAEPLPPAAADASEVRAGSEK